MYKIYKWGGQIVEQMIFSTCKGWLLLKLCLTPFASDLATAFAKNDGKKEF